MLIVQEIVKSRQQVMNTISINADNNVGTSSQEINYDEMRSYSVQELLPDEDEALEFLEKPPKSSIKILADIYKDEGIMVNIGFCLKKGFQKGYWISLLVFLPYSVVYFITYEKLKLQIHFVDNDNLFLISIISALSSCVAAIISNPFDVMKTQYQIQTSRNENSGIWSILLREKCDLFHRGLFARIIWAIPHTVISFTVFEYMKRL